MHNRRLILVAIAMLLTAGAVWYFAGRALLLEYGSSRMSADSTHDDPENARLRQRATELAHGINCNVDIVAAEELFRIAYENGDALAGGHLYMILRQRPNDDIQWNRVKWIWDESREAIIGEAFKGNPEARYLFSKRQINYVGDNPRLLASVRKELTQSSDDGYLPAMVERGFQHEKGILWERDLDEAMRWLSMARDQGGTYAIGGMGIITSFESYSGFNVEQALALLEEAGDRNDATALMRLGDLFYRGQFVEQDLQRALDCYSRATRHGGSAALVDVARMRMRGEGCSIDLAAARGAIELSLAYSENEAKLELLAELEGLEAAD